MSDNALRDLGDFSVALVRRFHEERATQTAGSLTFTTLLSLVPLITVALALASAFPVFEKAIAALQSFILQNALPETPGVYRITEQLNSFSRNAGRLTAIGMGVFAVTAVILMLTIDNALQRVFRVQRARTLLQNVLMYWAVLTLGPVLIGTSLSMSSVGMVASLGVLNLGDAGGSLLRVLPFVFTCAALVLLYGIVPARRVEWRHALLGGILAGIAFEIAKRAFALYLGKVPTYQLIYGAFATVPIFLLWLYLSWLVVLGGAVFTSLLPGWRGKSDHRRKAGEQFADALGALSILARAHAAGRLVKLNSVARELRVLPYRVEQLLEEAALRRWTVRTGIDRWVLSRDSDSISVGDIYKAYVYDAGSAEVSEDDFGLTLREYTEKERAA